MTLKSIFCLVFSACTAFYSVSAQNLQLKAIGQTSEDTQILESLDYQHKFSNYNTLQKEARDLSESLSHLGYLENELTALSKTNDSLYIAHYTIGPRYHKAIITYDSNLNRSLLKSISNTITDDYFEIELNKLEEALMTLNNQLANNGDPFVALHLANIHKNDGILYADLELEQKQQRTIDTIIVKGYDKFPKSFLKHYLKLKPGQSFNLKKIKEKTETLENLQFASQIKDPEVLFTKDSTLLYIYVEKQPSNTFDGFLGFGTNSDTDKIEFDGYLNLNLTNNLNYGESFKLLYKSDEGDQKTFDVQAQLPYLIGSPLGIQLGLQIFKKDSSYVTTSQVAKLAYQINPMSNVGIGIQTTASTNLLDHQILSIEDYKSTFYSVDYQFISPQRYDVLFPINLRFEVSAGIGQRRLENHNQSQHKFEVDAFKIFNLNFRNSLYGHFNAAILNSDDFVENELYRFGGINSIRGFEENSLYANLFSVVNTEYRYKVTNNLYVHTITDFAYYQNQILNTKQNLLGIGFGFGVLTQAGLFKLNYSNGSSKEQEFKFSNSKIHISLSAQF